MKATPLVDKLQLESENETDVALINFLDRGRRLATFGAGVGRDGQNRRWANLTIGVDMTAVAAEAKEKLDPPSRRLADLEHLLAAIPPCPAHGEGCIPYAMEWIVSVKEAGLEMNTLYIENERLKERLSTCALTLKVVDAQLREHDKETT